MLRKISLVVAVVGMFSACNRNTSDLESQRSHPVFAYIKKVPKEELKQARNLIDSTLEHEKAHYPLAAAHFVKGCFYYGDGKLKNAFRHWLDGLDHYNRADVIDPWLALSLEKNIGVVYKKNGDWQLAIDHYAQALEIAEKGEMNNEVLGLYFNIGNALSKTFSDTVPQVYYKGMKLAEKLNDKKRQILISMKLGSRLSKIMQYEEAELHLYRSYRLAQSDASFFDFEIISGQNLATCLFDQGKYDKALNIYQDIYKKKPLMSTAMDIGEIYLIQGDTLKAIAQWKVAEKMYEFEFLSPERYKIYDYLATYDKENEINYLRRYKEEDKRYKSQQAEIKEEVIDNFYLAYNNEKEALIAERVLNEKIRIGSMLVGLLLLMAGIAMTYNRWRRKQQVIARNNINSILDEIDKLNEA